MVLKDDKLWQNFRKIVLKEFILTKVAVLQPAVLLKTTSSTSIIQGFCLINW